MTIEQLMELSKNALLELADEKSITYTTRTTKEELAAMIYAKTNNQEESANVAQADEANSDDAPELGNGVFIVPGQMIKVQIRHENGDLKEGETSLDEVLSAKGFSVEKVAKLETEKTSLQAELSAQIALNKTLIDENEDLEKENEALKAEKDESSKEPETEAPKATIEWNDELELMQVQVRILPNSGVLNRIRAGLSFTKQYRTVDVNKETFDALLADNYLQVEPLKNVEQLDE